MKNQTVCVRDRTQINYKKNKELVCMWGVMYREKTNEEIKETKRERERARERKVIIEGWREDESITERERRNKD